MTDAKKETTEDAVERVKREQAEKMAAKTKAEAKQTEPDPDPSKTESTVGNEALQKQAEENLAKVLNEEPEQPASPFDGADKEAVDAAQKAAENLRAIALSYPRSSPDSHTIFGAAGRKFTLGELRALFNLKQG